MRIILTVTAVALLWAAAPACAQSGDAPLDACNDKGGAKPAEAIVGCTSVINSERNQFDAKNLAGVYSHRGVAYDKTKDRAHAVADYDESIRLHPNSTALTNRGWDFYLRKNYVGAMADFNAAISLDPQKGDAFANRGLLNLERREYKRAVADFSEAMRLDPKDATGVYGRSLAESKLGQIVGSRADLERALKMDPNVAKVFEDVRAGRLYSSTS